METSPCVPSNADAFQQGLARKQNVEPAAANAAPPLPPQEMRQKVVEILSNTANGCLQELGYYPGMSTRLQELEVRNQNWQKENVKLYDNNKHLLETIRTQTENLNSLNTPEGEKIRRINHLELENRALRGQLEQMAKAEATDNSQQAGQEQKYASLYKEHAALIDTYNRAYHEILRLRELIKTGKTSTQLQQYQDRNASQLLSQPSQVTTAMDGRRPLQPPLQILNQGQVERIGPIPGQQQYTSLPTSISPVNQQLFIQQQQHQNLLRNDNQTIPSYTNHQTHLQHPSAPGQHLRRPSSLNINTMNATGSLSHIQQQMPFQNPQPISIHRPTPSTSHNAAPTGPLPLQPHIRQNAATTQNVQHLRRASNPITSPDHDFIAHNSQQSLFRPSQPPIGRGRIRIGSAPLPNPPHRIDLPPPPASAPLDAELLVKSFDSIRNARVQPALSMFPVTGQQLAMPTTVSPNDIYIAPPNNMLAAPVPTFPLSSRVPFQIAASFASPLSQPAIISNIPSADELVELRSAYSSPSDTMALKNGNPSHPSPSTSLKREVASLEKSDRDVMEESNKKPRLGSSDMDLTSYTNELDISSIATEATVFKLPILPVISTPTDETMEQTLDADEEEEEEEEIVEVGPDGLRLVEDILEQVYGQNRRGEVVCWFCKYRFEKGVTTVPPTAFHGANDQELEAHCVENHEVAWNQARASV